MRPILAAAAALALSPAIVLAQPTTQSPAQAQAQGQPMPRLVIGAPGSCQMTVDNDPRPCSSGLVYVQHRDGAILLSVQSGRGVTIGFQADRDSQPRPEEYRLGLTRMHTSIDGRSMAKQVRGSCDISMSTDGQTWHRATCEATDLSGSVTRVTFTGNGQQVSATRPDAAGAPAAWR
ncbi:hypothetical protein BKE38_13645 [Pseudoroseomonas deserti]|uniref:Uncharacterized protein n=1 Tax=Teichococcus deserti TaxID=1817963 RepID=A0A1V2H212_9PROT|nr:hypothetical protein [Pseudoroseomonas deserti]ONG53018.1 hypothetical protein BKE38_13645 [Pseudoroseomonas deserti]